MKIEMNIGLPADRIPAEAAVAAIRLLSESLCFGRVESRIQPVSYTGPSGREVVEHSLVVRAAARNLDRIPLVVFAVAERLGQDCIAVLYVGDDGFTGDGETGELIGPRAAEWGAFNPEFFVRFEAVADATEQAAA